MDAFLSETMLVLAIIAIAEIGDKTMLITIAFAARYPLRTVLLGIIPACIAVPALGVVAGVVAKFAFSPVWVSIISGCVFLALVPWTIHEMALDDELDERPRWWHKFGPVMIVFCGFAAAESFDKTQLATIALATGGGNVYADWLGSSLGLILANGIALFIVKMLGKVVSKILLLYVATVLFAIAAVWMFADAFSVGDIKWVMMALVAFLGLNPLMYRVVWDHLHRIDDFIVRIATTLAIPYYLALIGVELYRTWRAKRIHD